METWRTVWRNGFSKVLPKRSLEALRDALRGDDSRLTQGSTCTPPPLNCVRDWPVEAGCAIGFCGAIEAGGFGEATVGEVEELFAKACFDCDQILGEPAECRHFLNFFDDTPRTAMRRELLVEVEITIASRQCELVIATRAHQSNQQAAAV